MNEQVTITRAEEFAVIINKLRQRFHQEEIDFLKRTKCLSIVQLDVLLIIAMQQPCTMGQVAKKVPSLSLSSITVIVDKLVKTNFVKRIRCEEDRRVVRVELTREGKELYEAHREMINSISVRLLNQLTEDEQEGLLVAYRKIISNMK
jgi:DNA-binding MarR family transcriptional regulator